MKSRSSNPGEASDKWTEEKAREVLAQLEQSGQTLRAFAKTIGVTHHKLAFWRKRLGPRRAQRKASKRTKQSTFVPVKVVTSSPSPLELKLGPFTLRLPSDADPNGLAHLLAALARKLELC